MSSRSWRAFLVTALQDADAWVRFVAHAGFVVDQRLESPLGPDGTVAAQEGTVLLVLKQSTAIEEARRPRAVATRRWRFRRRRA